MTDLVARLRADTLPGERQYQREARTVLRRLLDEAADEIERLRAEIDRLTRERDYWARARNEWEKACSLLEAENKTLQLRAKARAALKETEND